MNEGDHHSTQRFQINRPLLQPLYIIACIRQNPSVTEDELMKRNSFLAFCSTAGEMQSLDHAVEKLYQFLRPKHRVLCITGAGLSTASGIPDYRGVNGSYSKGHKPMVHSEFMSSHSARQRYWSRSIQGIKLVDQANPNRAHFALKQLEQRGVIKNIITQNVDCLHEKAGSVNVLGLHGRIDQVKCMTCHSVSSRQALQVKLESLNSQFIQNSNSYSVNHNAVRADGDMETQGIDSSLFVVPTCDVCSFADGPKSAILKPNVVFFGDNVPIETSNKAMHKVLQSDGVIVIGSTIEVYSVFRLVRAALISSIPIAIINQGETRIERELEKLKPIANSSLSDAEQKPLAQKNAIRFRSDIDCGLLLEKLCAYYAAI